MTERLDKFKKYLDQFVKESEFVISEQQKQYEQTGEYSTWFERRLSEYNNAKAVLSEDNPRYIEILEELLEQANYNGEEISYKNSDFVKTLFPDSFCIYPFVSMTIDPDGSSRPCCKFAIGQSTTQLRTKTLPDSTIEDLFNQEWIHEVRKVMVSGKKHPMCKACWDEEAAGAQSTRLMLSKFAIDKPITTILHDMAAHAPSHLDLKLSNLCNLKCRICHPFLSSQWIKEYKDLNTSVDENVIKFYTKNSAEKLYVNENNEDILKRWAKNLTVVEFYGGEPLMQQEHEKTLQIITTHGTPENIRLMYNSNATQFDERFFKYWKHFRNVTINFSVDDINDRFEYQRKNAKFNEVFTNLSLFVKYAQEYEVNYEFNIYNTISILNVMYLPQFLTEMKKLNMPIWLNLVHTPSHYSIRNLPQSVKNTVQNILKDINVDDVHWNKDSISVMDVISFMMTHTDDPVEFENFKNTTRIHDKYRNESFEEIFPELSNELNK
jgi:MoaA/NifB/PqqE/SkfB family radical SAM enzyme